MGALELYINVSKAAVCSDTYDGVHEFKATNLKILRRSP